MGKTIRSNEHGQISYNSDKGEYYLEFGNVWVTFDELQYREFSRIVKKLSLNPGDYGVHGRVKVPFESDNIALVFSFDEIVALKDLFDEKQKAKKLKLKINFSVN